MLYSNYYQTRGTRLKHLIDFIETKDVSKASIFEHLKCTKEEAQLVQYICKRYVSGLEEVSVLEILQDNFLH